MGAWADLVEWPARRTGRAIVQDEPRESDEDKADTALRESAERIAEAVGDDTVRIVFKAEDVTYTMDKAHIDPVKAEIQIVCNDLRGDVAPEGVLSRYTVALEVLDAIGITERELDFAKNHLDPARFLFCGLSRVATPHVPAFPREIVPTSLLPDLRPDHLEVLVVDDSPPVPPPMDDDEPPIPPSECRA